jgi:energy-coupling factor transporter ATP-binding protein EcfA2
MATRLNLTGFRAQHYKPFTDTGWISLRPITLLFGHNSSGKSAVLSILPMLRQTMEDPNQATPLVLSSDTGVDLGAYEDVAYRHEVSLQTPILFGLELSLVRQLEPDPTAVRLIRGLTTLSKSHDPLKIEFAASYNKKKRQIAITDFSICQESQDPLLRLFRRTTAANQPWHIEPETLLQHEPFVTWRHFTARLVFPSSTSSADPLADITSSIASALQRDLASLVHIGPLRDYPRRAYRLTGESPRDVGEFGQHWLSMLLQARARDRLTRDVNSWLKRMGYTIHIEWGKQGYVHPVLTDPAGVQTSLKDVGFGISQILPLLIQGFSASPGTILILEQPEIHLHPRGQAELADILLAIANRGVRLLVETHSEHLLLRLQRRIAESSLGESATPRLSPDDMAVYFIHRGEQASTVHGLVLDPAGHFVDPPQEFETFFSQDYDEAIRWTEATARIASGDTHASST